MQIAFAPPAARQFARIDPVWRARIKQRLLDVATDTASHSGSIKMLKGDKQLRLRVGDYRVLYTADGIVLTVEQVGHRGDIYRRT